MARRSVSLDLDPDTLADVRGNCFDARCPAREVLGHVTGRWGGLVLAALRPGTMRFSELRARIAGISEKMLAQTLRELERDGLVGRRSHATVPPRVDYTLTPGGVEVARRLEDLIGWLESHVRDLVAAHQNFARNHPGNGPARPAG